MRKTAYSHKNKTVSPAGDSRARILIVDGDSFNRRFLSRLLSSKGQVTEQADSAAQARKILERQTFDLILSEIHMPDETGIDFIRFVLDRYPHTAVVMISSIDDPQMVDTIVDIGAYGYLVKPFKTPVVLITIANALHRSRLEIENRINVENLENTVRQRTETLQVTSNDLQASLRGTVQAMVMVVETRDPYTAGHQQRVSDLAGAIAEEMGLSERFIAGLKLGGVIHDLGKISIPAEILSKPTRLSKDEYELIKTHSQAGFEILKGIKFPWPIAQMVIQHHEKMNGTGYPHGLAGDDILLESRILAVADVVEAMASHRPYRPALGIDKALGEISKNRDVLYDAAVADACLNLFRQKGFTLINT